MELRLSFFFFVVVFFFVLVATVVVRPRRADFRGGPGPFRGFGRKRGKRGTRGRK